MLTSPGSTAVDADASITPLVATIARLLEEDDYAYIGAATLNPAARNRWRRVRRKAVRSCCREIWTRSGLLFRQWTAVAAGRQDFRGIDPHWERVRIALALGAVSALATWRITLGCPAPASVVGPVLRALSVRAA